MSHYLAGRDDDATRSVVARLRTVSSIAQGTMPLVAGVFIQSTDRNLGFLVSLACYAAAGIVLSGLPSRAPAPPHPGAPTARPLPAPLPATLRVQIGVVALVAMLSWIANVLYTAYLLVDLNAGALGFGFALALWGGAGILSAGALGRLRPRHPEWAIFAAILSLAVTWAVMTQPVDFWVAAGLGVPEGFVIWLMVDLLQARTLMEAPAHTRARWTAVAAGWSTGGQVAGLALVLALPFFGRVHAGFMLLAAVEAGLAALWAGWSALYGRGGRHAAVAAGDLP
jgi:hypothetical protein